MGLPAVLDNAGRAGVELPRQAGARCVRGGVPSGAGFPERAFGCRIFRAWASRRGLPGVGLPPSAGLPRAGLLGCRFPRHGVSGRGASRRGLPWRGLPWREFSGHGVSGAGFPVRNSPAQTSPAWTSGDGLHGAGFTAQGFTAQAPRRSPTPRCGASQRSPAPRQTFLPAGAGALANRSFPNSPPCAGATKRRRVLLRGGESDFGVPA